MPLRSPFVQACLPWLLFVGVLVWIFGRVFFAGEILTYRDSGQFFHHWFHFIQAEWDAGRVPLWNPYSNCGVPVVANATSSVFYPLKAIFFLPLPFGWLYNLYVLCHYPLAAGFAFALARHWKVSRQGAAVCALSYALCGNVLYQYSNVIFLVGAAWLPATIWAADYMARRRSIRAALLLGGTLALMVLGGDPQMAYNAGFLAASYLLFVGPRGTANGDRPTAGKRPGGWLRSWGASLVDSVKLLSFAAATALLLAAIQILPTQEWLEQCGRNQHRLPRSVYELPMLWSEDRQPLPEDAHWSDALLAKTSGAEVEHQAYLYSVPPWRLGELIWPWFSGASFSQNQRWIYQLSDQPIWAASLYMGLLPLLLAVSSWRVLRTDRRTRWLSLIVIGSLLAGFGEFGAGWLLHLFVPPGQDGPAVGDAFGGVYWLMNLLLPGYAQFRWPGKLLVITALGLSLLAGFGWDRALKPRSIRLDIGLGLVVLSSVVGIVALMLMRPAWNDWLSSYPASTVLGPFDSNGAYEDLLFSLIYGLGVAGLSWTLLILVRRKQTAWIQAALLLLIGIDLACANGWMIVTISSDQYRQESLAKQLITGAEQASQAEAPYRVHRVVIEQPHWKEVSSADRFAELNAFGRESLQPMQHIGGEVELTVVTEDTFRNFDHELFLYSATLNRPDGSSYRIAPRRALDALNTKYFVLPNDSSGKTGGGPATLGLRRAWKGGGGFLPSGAQLPTVLSASQEEQPAFEIVVNSNVFPRCWIVHDIAYVPAFEPDDIEGRKELSRSLVYAEQGGIDLRRTAVVERDQPSNRVRYPTPAGEQCQIVKYEPRTVEIVAKLGQPGLLVLSDLFESNWVAEDVSDGEPQPLEIVRTNRIMRGVLLDSGEHHVRFTYRPARFYIGAWISGVSWLLFVVGLGYTAIRRRRGAS